MPHILLEPIGVDATRLSCSGNKAELLKLLSDAIAAHPGFAMLVLDAVKIAHDYVKDGGETSIKDLKQNPVNPSQN